MPVLQGSSNFTIGGSPRIYEIHGDAVINHCPPNEQQKANQNDSETQRGNNCPCPPKTKVAPAPAASNKMRDYESLSEDDAEYDLSSSDEEAFTSSLSVRRQKATKNRVSPQPPSNQIQDYENLNEDDEEYDSSDEEAFASSSVRRQKATKNRASQQPPPLSRQGRVGYPPQMQRPPSTTGVSPAYQRQIQPNLSQYSNKEFFDQTPPRWKSSPHAGHVKGEPQRQAPPQPYEMYTNRLSGSRTDSFQQQEYRPYAPPLDYQQCWPSPGSFKNRYKPRHGS